MKKNLLEILRNHFPNHVFSTKYSEKHKCDILIVDGNFGGYYDVIEGDINSYYALDSEKTFIELIGKEIKRNQASVV